MKSSKVKRCTMCGIGKLTSQFYKNKRTKDGLYSHCKPCHCNLQAERRHVDHPFRLFVSSYSNSYSNGIEHTITQDDIVCPEVCPYLGCKIDYSPVVGKRSRKWNAPSIDRIDSSKGYVPGNVQVISFLANRMKQDATPKQLIAFAKGVFRIHGNT